MRSRLLQFTSLTAMMATPTLAQFGIAGMRKPKTSFEEAQEQAKQQEATIGADGSASMEDLLASLGGGAGGAGGGGAAGLENMQKMMNDPALMEAFEKMQNMDPAELQKQMEEAMNLLTGDDSMIEKILEKREEVIEQLETTKAVPEDEIAKFKADPQYFELKMRESFDQMQNIFSDPEAMKMATDALGAMGGAKGMLGNLGKGGSDEMASLLQDSLNDDDKLEEARLEVLKGDNPLLSKLFEAEEMQAVLNDPVKWRETVKEGFADLMAGNQQAAGVGADAATTAEA